MLSIKCSIKKQEKLKIMKIKSNKIKTMEENAFPTNGHSSRKAIVTTTTNQ